ncbi:MAG: hypothetical protein MEQ84_07580 [Mesorhizobium sp.]|nr:hypothetical protein [Mesorhizobium sp.]
MSAAVAFLQVSHVGSAASILCVAVLAALGFDHGDGPALTAAASTFATARSRERGEREQQSTLRTMVPRGLAVAAGACLMAGHFIERWPLWRLEIVA